MPKWKVLPIPLQLLGASSGKNEKEDVLHAISQPSRKIEEKIEFCRSGCSRGNMKLLDS